MKNAQLVGKNKLYRVRKHTGVGIINMAQNKLYPS
jgi:hypothetical protein